MHSENRTVEEAPTENKHSVLEIRQSKIGNSTSRYVTSWETHGKKDHQTKNHIQTNASKQNPSEFLPNCIRNKSVITNTESEYRIQRLKCHQRLIHLQKMNPLSLTLALQHSSTTEVFSHYGNGMNEGYSTRLKTEGQGQSKIFMSLGSLNTIPVQVEMFYTIQSNF